MPFWQLYYHVVWSTAKRHPFISQRIEQDVHDIIRRAAHRYGVTVHAIGGTDDHIHLVCEVPPTIQLSTAVGRIKGASTHEINQRQLIDDRTRFGWQSEYGITSFARSQLAAVVRYAHEQRPRHQHGTVRSALERADH